MNYAYVQPIKPIALIKQEFRKYARNISHSLIIMVIVQVLVITSFLFINLEELILFNLVVILIFLLVILLIFSGISIYKIVCEYKLSKSLDDLGLYYMQETNTAKKASEMLKIALLVSIIVGGIISFVLYIIAYYRTAETFNELNKNELFPKQESRLVYKSFIASIIAQIIFLMSYAFFIFEKYFNDTFSVITIIFVGISSALLIATYIAKIFGFYRLGDDALLIVERQPSSYVPVQQPYQQQRAQYSHSPTQTQLTPSIEYHKDQSPEESSFCPSCGNPTADIMSFCTKCGTKLD